MHINLNEVNRQAWLANVLHGLPQGARVLDAGAGELKNRKHCMHLNYVSQDACKYTGNGVNEGLHTGEWDTSEIDIISDITNIPEPSESFDAILCSEVLEHVPEPTHALDEFARLLRSGGSLILTAPFSSNVHFAPYYYCSGFSKYWYQHHLELRGFSIITLEANGDWSSLLRQEILRLGGHEFRRGRWTWPAAYLIGLFALAYFSIRGTSNPDDDLACFGWNCIAVKR